MHIQIKEYENISYPEDVESGLNSWLTSVVNLTQNITMNEIDRIKMERQYNFLREHLPPDYIPINIDMAKEDIQSNFNDPIVNLSGQMGWPKSHREQFVGIYYDWYFHTNVYTYIPGQNLIHLYRKSSNICSYNNHFDSYLRLIVYPNLHIAYE